MYNHEAYTPTEEEIISSEQGSEVTALNEAKMTEKELREYVHALVNVLRQKDPAAQAVMSENLGMSVSEVPIHLYDALQVLKNSERIIAREKQARAMLDRVEESIRNTAGNINNPEKVNLGDSKWVRSYIRTVLEGGVAAATALTGMLGGRVGNVQDFHLDVLAGADRAVVRSLDQVGFGSLPGDNIEQQGEGEKEPVTYGTFTADRTINIRVESNADSRRVGGLSDGESILLLSNPYDTSNYRGGYAWAQVEGGWIAVGEETPDGVDWWGAVPPEDEIATPYPTNQDDQGTEAAPTPTSDPLLGHTAPGSEGAGGDGGEGGDDGDGDGGEEGDGSVEGDGTEVASTNIEYEHPELVGVELFETENLTLPDEDRTPFTMEFYAEPSMFEDYKLYELGSSSEAFLQEFVNDVLKGIKDPYINVLDGSGTNESGFEIVPFDLSKPLRVVIVREPTPEMEDFGWYFQGTPQMSFSFDRKAPNTMYIFAGDDKLSDQYFKNESEAKRNFAARVLILPLTVLRVSVQAENSNVDTTNKTAFFDYYISRFPEGTERPRPWTQPTYTVHSTDAYNGLRDSLVPLALDQDLY